MSHSVFPLLLLFSRLSTILFSLSTEKYMNSKCYHLGIRSFPFPTIIPWMILLLLNQPPPNMLEVTVTHNLNWDQRCDNINFVIRLIARLVFWEGCCRIGPQMSNPRHCFSVWNPYTKWNIHQIKLQSWTKVLGTVLRYSYFSVICRFPLKTVHHSLNFLAVLPSPTLYKVELETRNKFRIHASNIVCGVRLVQL